MVVTARCASHVCVTCLKILMILVGSDSVPPFSNNSFFPHEPTETSRWPPEGPPPRGEQEKAGHRGTPSFSHAGQEACNGDDSHAAQCNPESDKTTPRHDKHDNDNTTENADNTA